MERKKTRRVTAGTLAIGGGAPISIQSMTTTDTRDVEGTLRQVLSLAQAGCDIVRLAVFDDACMDTIRVLKRETKIPLVADIHFDHRLALEAIEAGIDKLRINPGNIGSQAGVEHLTAAAKERGIPIRIGVNAGSLSSAIIKRYGVTAQAMTESALEHIRILEALHFYDIVISLKASDVMKTIDAYRTISTLVDYPLHLGITEAGTLYQGLIKSAAGIGCLLAEGIGDTVRFSLTADPLEEVKGGRALLQALGLRRHGLEIISCPTCGRCSIDLIPLAERLQDALAHVTAPIKLAVMGCIVNGPGEAREADIGIAGGKGRIALFKKGAVVGTYPEEQAFDVLMTEIQEMIVHEGIGNHTGL